MTSFIERTTCICTIPAEQGLVPAWSPAHAQIVGLKKMDRSELLRLMPRDASDTEGARSLVDLGYPTIGPVHRDMIQLMRAPESAVADIFANYFAEIGAPAAPAVAEGLHRENCWLRYRLFTQVFPSWPDSALSELRYTLTPIATQPDACNNDLRCIGLLAERGLADLGWLAGWLEFKRDRQRERDDLIRRTAAVIEEAQQGGAPNP